MGGHFQNEDGSLNRLKRIKRCKPNAMAFTVFKQEVCIEIVTQYEDLMLVQKKEREHTFAFLLTNSSTKLPTIITSPGRPACHLWSILAHNTLLVSSLLVAIPAHVRQSSPPHHRHPLMDYLLGDGRSSFQFISRNLQCTKVHWSCSCWLVVAQYLSNTPLIWC